MPQIIVERLSKSYRVSERNPGLLGALHGLMTRRSRLVDALCEISFSVERGEVVGYIGPNGAGKSTTVKLLAGILVPNDGLCEVEGITPWRHRILHVRRIGVVFGQRSQLWWDLPVIDSFDLLRDIYDLERVDYRAVREELISRLDIGQVLATPARQLSLGQRMRCDLVAALLHRPRILFLDEPTIGLDAVSKHAVRDFLSHLSRDHGVTILLTTHDMDDIEALATRVMVIGSGRILSDGPLDGLRRQVTEERRLIVDLETDAGSFEMEGTQIERREGSRVFLRFDPTHVPVAELIGRITARYSVRDLFVENLPIEEIIRRLYAKIAA